MEYIYTEKVSYTRKDSVFYNFTVVCGRFDPNQTINGYNKTVTDKMAEYHGSMIKLQTGYVEFIFETEQDKMFFLLKYS